MRQLLEDVHGEFICDRKNIRVHEGVSSILCDIPGRLSVVGVKNGNNRVYGRNVWEKNLAEGSPLRQMIASRSSFGLLEHPKDGVVDLTSPISHITTEASLDGDDLVGSIRIINTPEGNKLRALIEAGWNPTVSSRGHGSLVRNADGIDEVQEDFVCEGWDVVKNPSFVQAILTPNRSEPAPTVPSVPAVTTESQPAPAPAPVLESKAAPQPTTQPTVHYMDPKQIKESVASLRQQDAKSVTPARFAEGMRQMEALHANIDTALKADALTPYAAQKLHSDLESIEESWSSAANAPVQIAEAANKANIKLKKIILSLGESTVALKKAFTAKVGEIAETEKTSAEVARRGRGWQERALLAEKSLELAEEKLASSVKTLHLFRDRWAADSVALSETVLNLEFADFLAKNEEIAKEIKEAKHPNVIGRIREKIEKAIKESSDAAAPADDDKEKKTPEASAAAPVAGEKKNVAESKGEPKEQPTPKADDIQYIASTRGSIGSVSESIRLAKSRW